MAQRNHDLSDHRTARARFVFALCLCAATLSSQGCTPDQGSGESVSLGEADFAALEIWAHPDTVGIEVYSPLDFKAASRTVAWAIDGVARGVMRYEPAEGKHGVFGFQDRPPAQVVSPARLAVGESGIFVFDDSTGMVDLYSPGGTAPAGIRSWPETVDPRGFAPPSPTHVRRTGVRGRFDSDAGDHPDRLPGREP